MSDRDLGPLSPRGAALDLLEAVLRRGRTLDNAIPDHPGFAGLDGRDRAFARLLTATTLRRLGQIDAVIDAALGCDKARPEKMPAVCDGDAIGLHHGFGWHRRGEMHRPADGTDVASTGH